MIILKKNNSAISALRNDKNKLTTELIDEYKKIRSLAYLSDVELDDDINSILLRGNPGLGKTSLIIYLLCELKDFKMGNKDPSIYLYKGGNNDRPIVYEYKCGILSEVEESTVPEKVDLIISDSYNCEINSNFVLFISSSDQNSYKNFVNYNGGKQYVYFDVFSKNEIEEWKVLCLPTNLVNFIDKYNLTERYGRVPRHIYFATIYGIHFGRDYWNENYTTGMNAVISNLGFTEFIQKYILPGYFSHKEISKLEIFDVSLSHYLIKYSYKNLMEISEDDMEFISDEVVEYIFDAIHHLSNINDIHIIVDMCYGYFSEKQIPFPLFQLLFQELVWCKCVYNLQHLTNAKDSNNNKPLKLYAISPTNFKEKFCKLFKCGIYTTCMNGIYSSYLNTKKQRKDIFN